MMDANRTDWYVRHYDFLLRVGFEYVTDNLTLFQNDSSFILHSDSFYPNYYSLESLNFPGYYIRLRDDGLFWIENKTLTTAYLEAASFSLHGYNTTGMNC